MIDVAAVEQLLHGHAMVRGVKRLPRGHVRIETAFLNPDGSQIDVYIVDEMPTLPPTRVSDLGNTAAWLMTMQVRPWQSKKRQQFLEDALRPFGGAMRGGEIELALPSMAALPDAVVRLGQACARAADLIFTRRTLLVSEFSEQVEELLIDIELPFDSAVQLPGKYGRQVPVDYLVAGPLHKSAILTLTTGNTSQAHVRCAEISARWYDLHGSSENHITVFDDSVDVYRPDDLERLRDLSDLVPLSDRDALRADLYGVARA